MKGWRTLTWLVLPALLLAGSACVRPDTMEMFVSSSKAEDGVYIFDFELPDTLATYDFSFFVRVDGPQLDSLPLKVMWLDPAGESFTETVYMDPGKEVELYRKDVVPVRAGDWRICVRPSVTSEGFRGLGLICKENGTR